MCGENKAERHAGRGSAGAAFGARFRCGPASAGLPTACARVTTVERGSGGRMKTISVFCLALVTVTVSIAVTGQEDIAELRQQAEQGNTGAQLNLGVKYYHGDGVPQSYVKAVKWFRKAAEQGDVGAQSNLGVMYDHGHGVPQDYVEAAKWYRRAAEQGVAGAQYNMGLMYGNGKGVPHDYAEAFQWYRMAAEQGIADAQYNIGWMYGNGLGVAQSYAEALKWFRKAAEQGDASAQFNLALMHANGQGVLQDNAEAVKWYRKAAEQGHASAQYNLGAKYGNGDGVPQSDYEAYIWFSVAAVSGHDVKQNLQKAARHLSRSQRVAAQQEVARRFEAIQQRQVVKDTSAALYTAPTTSLADNKIRPHGDDLSFSGEIEIGDAATLKKYIRRGGTIRFDSGGGDIHEAMKLGRLLRENLMTTSVLHGVKCYSACILAFAGGVVRQPEGALGIHSFYSENFIGGGNFTDADEHYNAVSSDIKTYLEEMRIDLDLLDHMKRVSHEDIKILNRHELREYFLAGIDPVYRQTHLSQ